MPNDYLKKSFYWGLTTVLYLLPYYTQIKHMYENMYLNYCIKHTKKKLQMDY